MAIPSGNGTEVLIRKTLHANNGDAELFSGTTGHIYTILSIIFCDQQDAAGNLAIKINDGANDIYIIREQSYGAYGTFVWNDKFTIEIFIFNIN